MADYIPPKDLDFQVWLANLITTANGNLAALGLVAGDMTALAADQTAYGTSLTTLEAARTAFNNATEVKDTNRRKSETDARTLVRKIQANPNVTPALKASLRITIRDTTPSSTLPIVPTELTAVGNATGTNDLKWNRNGNKPGTQFLIEAQIGTATTWTQIDIITATKYSHKGNTPGVKITYRIRARRAGVVSDPSNEAAIYVP